MNISFQGVETVVTNDDITIGQLDAASEDLRAFVVGNDSDTTPSDPTVGELMVMMKKMEERIQLLQEEAVQERKKTGEQIQLLQEEVVQERKKKEDSVAMLRNYTVAHGRALEKALCHGVRFKIFFFKLTNYTARILQISTGLDSMMF